MTYTSIRQLAIAVGMSHTAMGELLRRDDCPVPAECPKGGWTDKHVRMLTEFRGFLQEDRNYKQHRPGGSPEDAAAAIKNNPARAIDMRLKMERMLEIKLKREILAGLYINRADAERGWAQRAAYFRQSLETMPASVAPLLIGMDAAEIERELTRRVNEILDGYQRRPLPGFEDAAATPGSGGTDDLPED